MAHAGSAIHFEAWWHQWGCLASMRPGHDHPMQTAVSAAIMIALRVLHELVLSEVQVQVQVCFTSVCGQVQPLDVGLLD
jgi:hypothetical protein